MRGLFDAMAFLTRFPVPSATSELRPAAVPWFPVVGLLVGAIGGLVHWAVAAAVGPMLGAVAAVAAAVAVTGAFHEDGLADTFDGLSSIRPVDRQLAIMRDSRLGTFGVASLVLVLGARVVLVSGFTPGAPTVLALAWAHALSRGAVVVVMAFARPVAAGVGADHVHRMPRPATLAVATAVAAAGWFVGVDGWWIAPILAVTGASTIWVWAHRRIGGVTGDVLGACQQFGLLGALGALSA
ncbi:MAG TPA: adenosylcobinamide-GDP ribazoletransferase [Acidimicrobiia bacterium]|nr:adenosylcobinamide-GDP ribazoletransferase [Acidimicrobiia bacterium]